jgi:hypothetical protein
VVAPGYGLIVLGFLHNLSEIGKLPAELREELDAEGVIFTAGKVAVSRHFSGHVPGVYSASGVSRYSGGFGFSNARVIATFPTRGRRQAAGHRLPLGHRQGTGARDHHDERPTDRNRFTRSRSRLFRLDEAELQKKIPADVLGQLPATVLRFRVEPVFVYRAAGVRSKT